MASGQGAASSTPRLPAPPAHPASPRRLPACPPCTQLSSPTCCSYHPLRFFKVCFVFSSGSWAGLSPRAGPAAPRRRAAPAPHGEGVPSVFVVGTSLGQHPPSPDSSHAESAGFLSVTPTPGCHLPLSAGPPLASRVQAHGPSPARGACSCGARGPGPGAQGTGTQASLSGLRPGAGLSPPAPGLGLWRGLRGPGRRICQVAGEACLFGGSLDTCRLPAFDPFPPFTSKAFSFFLYSRSLVPGFLPEPLRRLQLLPSKAQQTNSTRSLSFQLPPPRPV